MRKQIYILSVILFFFSNPLFSQDWLWGLQIAGSDKLEVEDIKATSNNDIIVLSELTGNVSIGNTTFNSPNEKNILLLKLNKYGTILWSFIIQNSSEDDPKNIYVDSNNNIYLCGSFGGNLTFGDITITSTDEKDAFLAKINSDGNIVWAKNMGKNTGIQKGRAITSDSNNLYVLGFYYESVLLSRATDTLLEGTSNKNYFLVKYDMDGNFQNARRIYSSANKVLFSKLLHLNNYIYISGYYTDTISYDNDTLVSNNNSQDFILMKIDTNGNLIWANSYGGNREDELWDMTTDGNNIYVTGHFQDTINIDNTILTSQGNNDIFVGKFDQDGHNIWALDVGSDGLDGGLGLYFNSNKLVVTGRFSNSLNWNNIINANANTEPFIGYISINGSLINAVPITTSNSSKSRGYKVFLDNRDHTFVVGKFNASSIAFNSNIQLNNTNPGNSDGFIAKYGCFDGLTVNATDAGVAS